MAFTAGQAKCIGTLDRCLVVAAGAGSGKTFTLTKRIVHAIESGAVDGIDRVCAITFTNKAAGELKARIKAELRACGRADQALAVDEAWVSTIHGMCARILRAHALELDIDPKFAMADASQAGELVDRAVEEVLLEAQGDGPGGSSGLPDQLALDALFAEYPARSYGPRGSSVESMVKGLVELAGSRPDGFSSFAVDAPAANPAALVDDVLEAFEALAQAASAEKPNESREAWAAATLEACADIRADMQEGHAADAVWCLRALDSLEWPKKVGSADFKLRVAEAADVYRAAAMRLRLSAAAPHLATVVALAKEAHRLYAAAKRQAGLLDNNDLLVMAYAAVTGNPVIAAEYADKFQLVMIDEFQDTDQMQVDMVKALAGPGACRLCTVGDAQQSIYRFRGADVAVYNRHLRDVAAVDPESVIKLDENFRSHADVLKFVDAVFMQPGAFEGFMSLAPGRDEARVKRPYAAGEPRIQVQLTSNAYRGASADQVREVAAARIAATFAELRAKGHSAGDMAVLLGGMSHADVYAAALRARGLACVISGGSVFARTPEARLVADLVSVIADPYQTQALHNVLTGDLFQLQADDLLALTTAFDDDGAPRRSNMAAGLIRAAQRLRQGEVDGRWSLQLASALRVMGDAVDAAGRSSVSRIVMRVIVDSGLASRLEAQGAEGLASAANLYKAQRMVESVEAAGAVGPAGVAAAYSAMLADSKEAPGALSATGGDFVRIMTVHASKGLEFPIVAVGEFRDSQASAPRLLAGEAGGAVHLSLDLQNTVASLAGKAAVKDASALYAALMDGKAGEDELAQAAAQASDSLVRRAALSEREREGGAEESKRLLYVALTRAKEALVVSLRGKASKDNPLATPKSCLGLVVSALADEGQGFEVGRSQLPYGGSAPALVEHVRVVADDAGALGFEGAPDDAAWIGALPGGGAGEAGDTGRAGEAAPFMVPAPEARPRISRVPYLPAHEGVFSYSSVSEASHEGDLLDRLAERFFAGADAGVHETAFSLYAVPSDGEGDDFAFSYGGGSAPVSNHAAATVDEDDGSWAYIGSSCADADKATDLGTAFHRLAQHAVAVRGERAALAKPQAVRVEALARAGNLDDVQRGRLDTALDRWFGSDVASRMASFADLRAEAPFFLKLPGDLAPAGAYLEGEIDLLALDDAGERAVVVDYKTGGRADEAEGDLARKHVLQASCYAYAVMSQGVREVEAVFVRVERPRADDPAQPQCVRYRFNADDLPTLAQAIAEAYGKTR